MFILKSYSNIPPVFSQEEIGSIGTFELKVYLWAYTFLC